jgi:phosphoribosyl 1,2-cyclic phosphodiesterase
MKITLYGVRGSFPVPGPYTFKYGGNTSSILIEFNEEQYLVIDAGTGIRNLGTYLLNTKKKPLNINILFTHTHWDHIMGIPFFAPIYEGDSIINMYGPESSKEQTLKDIILSQLEHKYFPVSVHEIGANINEVQLSETTFNIFDAKICTIRLNHPCITLGYRIEYKDKVLVTVYDHEPFDNFFADDSQAQTLHGKLSKSEILGLNQKIIDFCENADYLIIDSQYTKKEYLTSKKGYGHSYFEYSLALGIKSNSRSIILFHHDPSRTDFQLDYIDKVLKNYIKENGYNIETILAKEGLILDL